MTATSRWSPWFWGAVVSALLTHISACKRAPRDSSPPPGAAAIPPTLPSQTPLPPYPIGSAAVLEKVQALVEVARLLSTGADARVVQAPDGDEKGAGTRAVRRSVWEIAVADRSSFDAAGNLQEGYQSDISARVDARTGELLLRTADEDGYYPYPSWKVRYHQRERATDLILSLPEFAVESKAIKTRRRAITGDATLGLMLDGEPQVGAGTDTIDCERGWRFMALGVCSGCAGHWEQFCVDPTSEKVFIPDMSTLEQIPYGRWRNEFRRQAGEDEEPAYQDLGRVAFAFPDYHVGRGRLGYGEPRVSVLGLRGAPSQLRAALAQGGYRLTGVARYGATRFLVLLVDAGAAALTPKKGAPFRDWGAALVRANGGNACELVLTSGERYQFDSWSGKADGGGVYIFKDDEFYPWIAPH